MIFWYENLYLDYDVVKDEEKCKKIILDRCRTKRGIVKKLTENIVPWKENFELLILANNPDNLFEIINTKQMFFRYYEQHDIYVVGIAHSYDSAVEIVRKIMVDGYGENPLYDPRKMFGKEHFVKA